MILTSQFIISNPEIVSRASWEVLSKPFSLGGSKSLQAISPSSSSFCFVQLHPFVSSLLQRILMNQADLYHQVMGIATAIAISFVPQFVEFQRFKVVVIVCKSAVQKSHIPLPSISQSRQGWCLLLLPICSLPRHWSYIWYVHQSNTDLSPATIHIWAQKRHRTGFARTDSQIDRIIRCR